MHVVINGGYKEGSLYVFETEWEYAMISRMFIL